MWGNRGISAQTKRVSPERERELSSAVYRAKLELLELLTPEERRSRHATHLANPKRDEGVAWTFEDSAQLLAEQGRQDVKTALRAYQNAINAMWIYLHSCEVSEKLYGLWRRKNRHLATLIAREDVEAEILFRIRDCIRRYNPTLGYPFLGYVPSVLFGDLTEWARNQVSVVSRPRDAVLRKETPPADTQLISRESINRERTKHHQTHRRKETEPTYQPSEEFLLGLIDKDNKSNA